MPLLLPEDYNTLIPPLYKVRQVFGREILPDIPAAIQKEFQRKVISGIIKPGMRAAVAVGSRVIRILPLIVKTIMEELKKLGAEPYIVSAMGSHGGGTEEGQREVLYGYGITEEAMGVPIVTTTEVVCLGEISGGRKVYFDKSAMEADVIIPVNRVKLHTDFVSDIQSGLCKMLVIGMGNHRGCTAPRG
nr:lactate racemase domain-containing protein [uncultured Blautia sp.]